MDPATALAVIDQHAEVVVEDTTAMSREDWLGHRTQGIGGSDAAASLDLNPYSSRYALWEEKANGVRSAEETERMFWGRMLEEPIGLGFAEQTGIAVQRFPKMLRSKRWPHMVVNLDFIGPADLSVVECKNSGQHMASEWFGEEGEEVVPAHYAIQGQHELAVTGLARTHFPVLFGGNRLHTVTIERDEGLIESLAEGEARFWQRVLDKEPPPIDGSDSTKALLGSLYSDPEPESIADLTEWADIEGTDLMTLLQRRAHYKAQGKAVKREIDYIENNIKAALGDREIGQVEGRVVVTWKKFDRAGFVVQPSSQRRINVPKEASK